MDELERRRQVSFLEAEGLKPPLQMSGHAVTKFTRIALLELLSDTAKFDGRTYRFNHFRLLWLSFFEEYGDDFPGNWGVMLAYLKRYIQSAKDVEILALIQAYCRQSFCTESHFSTLQRVLESQRLAYRLVGSVSDEDDPPTLVPVSTPEQADALTRDYAAVGVSGGAAVQKHLRLAATEASEGHFKSSVRESIHAVESAAKIASGKSNATLADALTALDREKIYTQRSAKPYRSSTAGPLTRLVFATQR